MSTMKLGLAYMVNTPHKTLQAMATKAAQASQCKDIMRDDLLLGVVGIGVDVDMALA